MVEVSGFLDETVERIFYFKVINEIVVGIYDLFLDLALLAIRPEVFKIGIWQVPFEDVGFFVRPIT